MRTPSIVFAIALVAAAVLLPFSGTIAEKPEEFALNVVLVEPAPATVPASGLRITDNYASDVRESIAFEHSPAKRGYGQG